MRELSIRESTTVSGGGEYYCDDFLVAGAAVALLTCAFINSKRRNYKKPVGSWNEVFTCTLITALELGAVGGLVDFYRFYR